MSLNRKQLIQIVMLLCAALTASSAFATTYYVDYSSGNDSNNGMSKSSPWQNAPGMRGCTAVCNSVKINPGDSVILKGGVTWPASTMEWDWGFSGSSGNNIYVGVDQTWFAGGSWSRPILNGGGALIPYGGRNLFLWIYANYVTFDNFEFTGLAGMSNQPYGGNAYINPAVSTYIDIKNNYFHGWSSLDGSDSTWCILSNTQLPGLNVGTVIEYNVIDGSDTAPVQADPNCTGACQAVGGALWYGPIISHNIIRYVSNGYVGDAQQFNDNLIEYERWSIQPSMHENGFENNSDPCSGLLFYNNVIRHTKAGVNIWMAPQNGCAPTYAWDNVVYDTMAGNVWDNAAALTNPNGTLIMFNNTIECGLDGNANQNCVGCSSAYQSCTIQNNFFITSSQAIAMCGNNCTASNNLIETQAAANSQGYSASETYGFSPSATSSPTVGKGLSLSSLTLSNLMNSILAVPSIDTTFACSYSASSHTAVCPGRTAGSRGGTWDIGAYQYASNTAGQPLPPTGLAATVN